MDGGLRLPVLPQTLDNMINLLAQVVLAANCATCTPLPVVFEDVTPNEVTAAALAIFNPDVKYVPDYQGIDYPMGDIDPLQGVCTDVVIRTFRGVGVDLQQEVAYLRRTTGRTVDTNIDHRRVPNIGDYLASSTEWVQIMNDSPLPGDIIWWKLGGYTDHIGVVVNNNRVMHNIGRGQVNDVNTWTYPVHQLYRLRSSIID